MKRGRRATAADLRRVLACVHDALLTRDLDALTEYLVASMPKLLETEIGGYNEADPGRGRFVTRMSDPDVLTTENYRAWAAHAHQNPLVNHILQNPDDLSVYRISDFVDPAAFRNIALCAELYTPLRVEHQMSMPFPVMDGAAVAMTFNRDQDYTDRERDILKLVQPCLIAAYRNAQRLTDLRVGQQDLLTWFESARSPIALVTPRGRILGAAPGIVELLDRFAPDPKRRPNRLPDAVARWWRRSITVPELGTPALGPMTLRSHDELLRLTSTRCASGENGILALQVSQAAGDSSNGATNLTRREIEVFRAVGSGMNNKAIAAALGLSVRTVEKHMENLLNKLGVKSRTAACALAARMFRHELPS